MITEYDGYTLKIVENPTPEMIEKSQERVRILKEKMAKKYKELEKQGTATNN